MQQNPVQPAGAQAPAQYRRPSQAVSGQGGFSTALAAALAQEGGSPPQAGAAGSASGLMPLLLSGFSTSSGVGLLLLALVLAQSGGGMNGGLGGLGGMDGMGSLLLGGLFAGGLGGGLTGGSGGLPGAWGGGSGGGAFGASAGAQASMAAAESLLKAYNNASGGAAAAQGAAAAAQGGAFPASTVGNRSASLYRAVLDGLDVENNPRYAVNQKGEGDTYCNRFLLDATAAMGAQIPRYVDADTGAPAAPGADNALAMNANRISDWLNAWGPKYGWYEVTAEQAQALANRGCPAVTTWKNLEGGHGHVQMVSPSKDGAFDPERGVAIAQAGRLLRNYTHIGNIYSGRLAQVQYFAHR